MGGNRNRRIFPCDELRDVQQQEFSLLVGDKETAYATVRKYSIYDKSHH
jgi:hypothetical protein